MMPIGWPPTVTVAADGDRLVNEKNNQIYNLTSKQNEEEAPKDLIFPSLALLFGRPRRSPCTSLRPFLLRSRSENSNQSNRRLK
jgi:hypothetical protein